MNATKSANLDDLGTTAEQARELLGNLLENGFDNDTGLLSTALGRPEEEINSFIDGDEEIDGDLLMKIRGIAEERDIEIES